MDLQRNPDSQAEFEQRFVLSTTFHESMSFLWERDNRGNRHKAWGGVVNNRQGSFASDGDF